MRIRYIPTSSDMCSVYHVPTYHINVPLTIGAGRYLHLTIFFFFFQHTNRYSTHIGIQKLNDPITNVKIDEISHTCSVLRYYNNNKNTSNAYVERLKTLNMYQTHIFCNHS